MESKGGNWEGSNEELKPKKKNTLAIVLITIALILIISSTLLLIIPFSFEKYSLTTGMVTYNAKESYQETVNSDNCNNAYGCVCTKHGGFLWLTCVQCSCTAERTVVREKLGLKEGTTTDSANLFEVLTDSKISEYEAKQTAQTLLNYISQNGGGYANIENVIKEGNNWKVIVNYQNSNMYIYISLDNGQILYVEAYGQKIPFSTYIAQINSNN